MIGLKVIHDILGSGSVTEVHGKYITVRFAEKSCRFVYPDAFAEHLTAENPERQASILKELTLLRSEENARIHREEAEKTAEANRIRTAKLNALTEELNSLIGLEQVKRDVQMHRFIESNPGLRSRFNKYFCFPDYSPEELQSIFLKFCHDNGYFLSEDGEIELNAVVNTLYADRTEHFGNARTVRNLFENVIGHQADRLSLCDEISDRQLAELTADDF